MKRGKREAKRTYGFGSRLLSVFLAVVMCTSMLQLTVFAAPGGGGGGGPANGADTVTVITNGVEKLVFKGDANDLAGQGDNDGVTVKVEVTGSDETGYHLDIIVKGAPHADGTKDDLGRIIADGASYDEKSATVTYSIDLPSGYSYTTGVITDGVVANISASEYSDSVIVTITTNGPIINVGTNDTISFAVAKVWDDGDDKDRIRPASVTINLLANSQATDKSVTLDAGNNWIGYFSDLPKNSDGGAAIAYTISEAPVTGYTSEIAGDATNGFTVTNTHVPSTPDPEPEPETTSISVTKDWNYGEYTVDVNQLPSVLVQLYADSVAVGSPVTLSAGNDWTYTWENLLVYADGTTNAIEYTVDEVNVPDNYDVAISATAAGYIITNTYVPQHTTGSITVTKSTSGAETPATATFQLQKQDGESWVNVGEAVAYSAFDANHSYTFSGLAAGTYHVVEADANIATFDLVATSTEAVLTTSTANNGDTAVSNGAITVTNTYSKQVGSLKITKTFTGNPEAVDPTFIVTDSADNVVASVKYSEFNNGTYHVIVGLPVGSYTVTETAAQVSGYHLDVTGDGTVATTVNKNQTSEVTITNTYTQLPPTVVNGQFSINFNKVVGGDAYTMSANEFAFNLFDETNTYAGYNDATGAVSISVPFEVNLANVTGNSATQTYTYTLSEQAGSTEGGMAYSSAEYEVSVSVNFSRANSLTAWTWSLGDVTVTGAEDSTNGTAITLTLAEGAALFTNTYTQPSGSLTINKRAAGDTDAIPGTTAFIVKDATGETVRTVYYKEFVNGSCTINLPVGTYTVTEDETSAKIDGYELKVVGGPTAKVEVAIGANAYVGFTNHYEKVPHAYTVVHEYYTYINGTSDPKFVGDNGGKEDYAKFAPSADAVYLKQADSENYKDDSYSKGALKDVVVSGELEKGTLVYTVKYYRNDWTVGALTINKTISGLDFETERTLKGNLSFVVTAPDGSKTEIEYSEFEDGSYTLPEKLAPGTYTVEEIGAVIDGGYDLNVVADDANKDSADGYQVEVTAGAEATSFNIENNYTGRIYNVWFNGGDHGSVTVDDKVVKGVNRNRVLAESDELITWSPNNLPNATNQYLYQIGESTIYPTIGMGPKITEEYGYVMYTFTWADYVNYKASLEPVRYLAADEDLDAPRYSYNLAIEAPGLVVDSKYKSDEVFYINDTEIAFDSEGNGIDAAVAYMNSEVTPIDGVYNVLYVPAYTSTGGGGGGGGGTIIIPEPPVPLDPAPQPEPEVVIPDVDVPLVEIPEEEIPLVDVPKTGDASALWLMMSVLSGTGLAGLSILGRNKKREEI